jgi:3-isopropylmalate/(R)-2-methylmalate dehydratase large subunit
VRLPLTVGEAIPLAHPAGQGQFCRKEPRDGALIVSAQARTLFEKIWDRHVIADYGGGFTLMHVDRLIVPDLSSRALTELRTRGIGLARPELGFGVADHAITTDPTSEDPRGLANPFIANLREQARHFGMTMLEVGEPGHGIMHVVSPELGIALPGLTLCCSDSHSCTIGALGALAWGIGGGELTHILATQTSVQRRPKTMRIMLDGRLPPGTYGKDIVLRLIGDVGVAAGSGYAVEYAGGAIRALPMEGRFTVCNMSVEFGARFGMIAPDDATLEYVARRPYAPRDELSDAAIADWRQLPSDPTAIFDREITLDVTDLAPQVTWGNNPGAVLPIDGRIPDPAREPKAERRREMEAALTYMDLVPGRAIEGTPIDWVFIGSCTNSRIADLRVAAAVVDGRKVAPNVRAWVVPGSTAVKQQAEAEGLDAVFRTAGFEWRAPGCSMCLGANGDVVPRGQRCVSTSNRNFVGRQGPGSRTHLASPALAAASACAGAIADPRKLM